MAAIQRLIRRFGAETEMMVKEAMRLSLLSKGSWSYETVLGWSASEREIGWGIITDRQKELAKHPLGALLLFV